jgi:hypothetical protein
VVGSDKPLEYYHILIAVTYVGAGPPSALVATVLAMVNLDGDEDDRKKIDPRK